VHGNLGPSNILYSYRPGHREPHFYISAVGLQTLQAPLTSLSGTTMYVAPETSRHGQFGSAADVYSFAMVLLELLGKYCPREASPSLFSAADWREKLRQYGAIHYRAYRDVVPARAYVPGLQVSHSRVQSLVDCTLLHSSLQHALHQEPSFRSTASMARAEIGDFVRMRCRGHREKQVVVRRIAWH
jgi:serine/threonine protein kinase